MPGVTDRFNGSTNCCFVVALSQSAKCCLTCKTIEQIAQLCYCIRDSKYVYRVLVGKPEGNRPLGRPRLRWEDNIKMELHEVGCGVWTGSSWFKIGTGDGHL